MRLPQSRGTIKCNMFLLLRVAPGILLCGIYEASEKLPVLCMEGVPEHMAELQATPLVEWL